jgi:hypothetical protein
MALRTVSQLAAFAALALTPTLAQVPAARGDDPAGSEVGLDAGSLRAVALDLLGRPPLPAERERWLGQGLENVLDEVVGGLEFWERWTEEQLYYFLLIDNFRPHTAGVLGMPEDLRVGRIGVREAAHRIAITASFDQRNPGPDTFVSVVMEQLLGLVVQDSPRELALGKRLYDGEMARFLGRKGGSQADVVRIAIEDDRFLPELLRREHRRFVRRDPPPRDLAGWARRLEEDPLAYPELVRGWMHGEAYEARLREKVVQPNRLYVRA